MTNVRHTAILATVSNALCDSILDYTVNRFAYYKVLFLTATIAMLGQVFVGAFTNIVFTVEALPYIFIHAVAIVIGYVLFVKSLHYLPLALAGLIETSSLFLTCLIDTVLGYLTLSFSFVVLLALFVFSVFLFTDNCKGQLCDKTLKPIGFIYLFLSVLLYLTAPYLVKLSNAAGANEIAINLGYYAVSVPFFLYQFLKSKNTDTTQSQTKWWQNIYFLCLVIGLLEALYYVFETMSFMNDTPTVVIVIMQMRMFLLFLLSVLFGTDKFTVKKFIALMLGGIAVTGVYLS